MAESQTKTKKKAKAHGGRRGWSTSTLYKYLSTFVDETDELSSTSTVSDVLDSLGKSIIAQSQR